MLEIIHNTKRPVAPYGSKSCKDSVNMWCKRILEKDNTIQLDKSEWKNDGKIMSANDLLFDAVMCQLWYAQHCLRDATLMAPENAYVKCSDAAEAYSTVICKILPRWKCNLGNGKLTSKLTCALQYLHCRERMLDMLGKAQAKDDLDALSSIYGTRACIALICSKFDHMYSAKDAVALSAEALYYKGADLKKKQLFSTAQTFFKEAADRYKLCGSVNYQRARCESQMCGIAGQPEIALHASDTKKLFTMPIPPL